MNGISGRLRAVGCDRWIVVVLVVGAAPVLFTAETSMGMSLDEDTCRHGPLAFAVAVLQAVPLLWRTRRPGLALVLTVAALTLRIHLGTGPTVADFALLFALEALGAQGRWRKIGATLAVTGGAMFVLLVVDSAADVDTALMVWPYLFGLFVVAPVALGLARRRRTTPPAPAVSTPLPAPTTPTPAAAPAPPHPGLSALTPREIEVLRLVGAGMSNPDIAVALTISRETVKTHVSNLLGKLGQRQRYELIAFAYRHGVVTVGPAPVREPATAVRA